MFGAILQHYTNWLGTTLNMFLINVYFRSSYMIQSSDNGGVHIKATNQVMIVVTTFLLHTGTSRKCVKDNRTDLASRPNTVH